MSVIETSEFSADAARLLKETEHEELVLYLTSNPTAGVLVPQSGGVRKLRWGAKGKGKRGGVRVIYYFHREAIPLFLLNLFAKNEKADLSPAERAALKSSIKVLVKSYLR